jgi:6-phosphogluconolactonase (cycloisomerase 2 family)
MPGTPNQWTRRAFSQACAAAAASSCPGLKAFASAITDPSEVTPDGFAYAACNPGNTHGSIHVFRTGPQRWTHIETVPALAPSHLERHPTLPVLYALHATELWQNLPRGAVSAWTMDDSSGRLRLLHTQPLALSATRPTHACITPDGTQMIVAATGGGALNVLPLDQAGRPGPAHILRKEVGRSDHAEGTPARPHQVVMHPAGKILFSADTGNESLRSFHLGEESLDPLNHLQPHPSAALSQIALSPCGRWMLAAHAENGSLEVFRLDPAGILASHSRAMTLRSSAPVVLAIHPSGDFLLTASSHTAGEITIVGEITVSRFDLSNGILRPLASLPHRNAIRHLSFSPDGRRLAAVESRTGRVITFSFDSAKGRLAGKLVATQLDQPVCLLQTNTIQPRLTSRSPA